MSTDLEARIAALEARNDQLAERLSHYETHATKLNTDPAQPRPNGPYSARIESLYHSEKRKLQALLRAQLLARYETLSYGDNFARGVIDDSGRHTTLEALPRVLAASLTRESVVRDELEGSKLAHSMGYGDNRSKIARLEVELTQREKNTADLLATTELPPIPQVLIDLIPNSEKAALEKQRIAHNTAAINRHPGDKPESSVAPAAVTPRPRTPKPAREAAAQREKGTGKPGRAYGAIVPHASEKQPQNPAEHRVVVGKRGDPNEYVTDGVGKTRQIKGPRPGEEFL